MRKISALLAFIAVFTFTLLTTTPRFVFGQAAANQDEQEISCLQGTQHSSYFNTLAAELISATIFAGEDFFKKYPLLKKFLSDNKDSLCVTRMVIDAYRTYGTREIGEIILVFGDNDSAKKFEVINQGETRDPRWPPGVIATIELKKEKFLNCRLVEALKLVGRKGNEVVVENLLRVKIENRGTTHYSRENQRRY